MSFTLRRVDPDLDAELLHSWVTHPKAVFWMMQNADLGEVRREYSKVEAYLGLHEGRPEFLLEKYDAEELAWAYPHLPGDVGMHFLVAPAQRPVHGFTRAVADAVMDFLFADPDTCRVVVEPDIRNTAVHRLNKAVGFQVVGEVTLPEKTALLSICTRDDYEAARESQ